MNGFAMARHGLILWANEANGLQEVVLNASRASGALYKNKKYKTDHTSSNTTCILNVLIAY